MMTSARNGLAIWSLVLTMVVGCERHAPSPVPASAVPTNNAETRDEVNWQRTKDCAAQAERVATRIQREEEAGTMPVVAWRNHYNRQDQRCYVDVQFSVRHFKSGNRTVPPLRNTVYDAFENTEIATYTHSAIDEAGEQIFCQRTEANGRTSAGGCEATRKFVDRKMSE